MLQPLGDRIVVKFQEKEQVVGGLVLAGSSQEQTKQAQVLAVGPGLRTLHGDLVAPSLAVGDLVLVEANAGVEVKDGDQTVTIFHESNILAIVK